MKRGVVRAVLTMALLATLLAAYFAPPAEADAVALSERVRSPRAVRSVESSKEVAVGGRTVMSIKPRADDPDHPPALFASAAWAPPKEREAPARPSPAPAVVERAAPQLPSLPFRVLGRFVDESGPGVFLQHNDRNLVVRVGDNVADHYVVEALNEDAVTLRYLPLNQRQTLDLPGAN